MPLDIDWIRSQFPALDRKVNGNPAIYFDGPGGTQVPARVADRVADYLLRHNANSGGVFCVSRESDDIVQDAREIFADFLGCEPSEVSFCHNSTTICFKLAEAIARDLKPGDEIIVTDIDHECNRSPWTLLAERGISVHSVRVDPETCTLDMDHYRELLSSRTRVVAANYASNGVGTVSDVKEIVRLANEVDAITVIDAVQYAAHGPIDVRDLGVDFLYCSPYKIFGPHLGVLYGRREAIMKVRTLRVAPQYDTPPFRFETGTLNHEGIAGAAEAIDFLAEIGARYGDTIDDEGVSARRGHLVSALHVLEAYEAPLAAYFKKELVKIKGVRLYGPPRDHPCTPTIAMRMEGKSPRRFAEILAHSGVFTWSGNFYAVELIRTLGLAESGGLLRIGLAPYNTRAEIDFTLDLINHIAGMAE
jgi:cysteine desulfurase family protein (TIGR01976 family)